MKARLYMLVMLTALATQSVFAIRHGSFRPEVKSAPVECPYKSKARLVAKTAFTRTVATAPVVVKKKSGAPGVR